jgi:hypothetical protein
MFTMTVDVMRAGMTRYPNKTHSSYFQDVQQPARRVPHLPSAPGPALMLYVMGHFPGNTPASFRRQFYGDLSHGMNHVNLYTMVTSYSGQTCDYTDADGGTWPAHRQVLNEFGMMDDVSLLASNCQRALFHSKTKVRHSCCASSVRQSLAHMR